MNINLSLVPLANRVLSVLKAAARVPHQPASVSAMFDFGFIGQGRGREQQLRSDTDSGWLFAVIDRIATSVMATEWSLYSGKGKGRELIDTHPLLDLWQRPNPFFSLEAFLELSSGYFDLVGEMWWLVVRDEAGAPREMWPLRPDRMRVIPHPENYIAGYEYRLGMERVPLDVEDIIYTRRPSKWDAYRGVSPVQTIMFDLEGEQFAARYYRNFFANSAPPGGVLETPEQMDDDEINRLTEAWRAQHQGVHNAHRVAILEGGTTWKDVKRATGRDMQMVESRKFNRDLIFGAYGIPSSVMGISENVNMANAETGQEGFQRDTVKPRLQRIRGSANAHLVPMFAGAGGPTDMFLDFADPVPENRELNLQEATEGFDSGLLTQNEARGLIGHGDVDGGDIFKPTSPPPSLAGDSTIATLTSASAAATNGQTARPLGVLVAGWQAKDAPDPDDPAYMVEGESTMSKGWEDRLEREAEAIGDYLEPFFKSAQPLRKIELADVEGYPWGEWMGSYGDEVIEELADIFLSVITETAPEILETTLQQRAAAYARTRGAALLRLDGEVNMIDFTRQRVRELVAQTIERGDGLGALRKALREDLAFSKSRADTVARTETREALGEGQLQGAGLKGQNEKKWMTQGDLHVDDPCITNAGAGWIRIEEPFPTGKQRVPNHPNCRCNCIYRTVDPEVRMIGRCLSCKRLLVKNHGGLPVYEKRSELPVYEKRWCPRCKQERNLMWDVESGADG